MNNMLKEEVEQKRIELDRKRYFEDYNIQQEQEQQEQIKKQEKERKERQDRLTELYIKRLEIKCPKRWKRFNEKLEQESKEILKLHEQMKYTQEQQDDMEFLKELYEAIKNIGFLNKNIEETKCLNDINSDSTFLTNTHRYRV